MSCTGRVALTHPLFWDPAVQDSSPTTSICVQIIAGNPHLRSLLGWHLQQMGCRVQQAGGVRQFREASLGPPNLVVLDTELVEGDALELCRWLRSQTSAMILILSAKATEMDVVSGLQAGADDYLTKPFGMQEFLARVEALTRRVRTVVPPAALSYGELVIDLIQRRVCLAAENIDLTPQEFSLLYVLVQAAGQALSRSDILRQAWPDGIDNPRTVDTHVLSLRKKLEVDPRQPSLIQTVRNVGYRFNPDYLRGDSTAVEGRETSPSAPPSTSQRPLGLGGRAGGGDPSGSSQDSRSSYSSRQSWPMPL